MKIRALNEPEASNDTSDESSKDEEAKQPMLSKEALEDQFFDKYRQALVAIQEFKEKEAKDLLSGLNNELKSNSICDRDETLMQLRFSVLKNLGNLKNDNIDYFVDALAIDPTDISLWIKAGDRGIKLSNFSFARHCYEQALNLNSHNWVAIDRLMEIYYILHLPFELYDICSRALALNSSHKKAKMLLIEAEKSQPILCSSKNDLILRHNNGGNNSKQHNETNDNDNNNNNHNNSSSLNQTNANSSAFKNESKNSNSSVDDIITRLDIIKRKRRTQIQEELQKFKKARLGITLDTARTQSLASFGNYIIKIYERFSKQGLTRNSVIDIILNNTLSFTQQQFNNNSINSTQSNNNINSSELQVPSSQDLEMAIENDATSVSDNDKSNNKTEQTIISNDETDQTKSSSRGKTNQQTAAIKGSSLSFAAMLFPMDLGDKRRSSRNRSNQDDTFSFKIKFDELNELLPECLRIGAIEDVLQRRKEEQQKNALLLQKEESVKKEETSVLVETNLEPLREDLIIKDIVESISEILNGGNNSNRNTYVKNDIKLCDMFYLYLSNLASKKQNELPDAFLKIYKIYRRLCPLPQGVFIEINSDITLAELWFTLTANEIEYQSKECPFLLRILQQLQMYLDENQHREFLVRLFLILGINYDYKYLELALENFEEDTRVYASNRKIITRAYIKTLIDRSNEKLQKQQDESESLDNSLEIIEKLAPKSENEMSDREILSLCSAIKSTNLWQRGIDILNQRNDLTLDVILDTINECLINGAKMDAILASKLCKDAISGSRPTTWSCLYRGWLGVLNCDQLEDEKEIEKMNKFFELGHQTLGKKNCCTSDKGQFLMLQVAHLLESEHFEERDLFAPMSCLFNYPSKKPASVVGHKAQKVNIIWDYAEVIYSFLVPEELPTYMSLLRKVGLTSELEAMFREIADVVPANLNPSKNIDVIENFIDKGQPMIGLNTEKNEVTKDLFYFLADYYFKNKDFSKAKQFYHYDLVINADRFDSWAASGLIRANGIDKALSEGSISESKDLLRGPYFDLANSAIRCFEQATKLRPNEPNATLWIEFGNLTYNLASLVSRTFHYENFVSVMDNRSLSEVETAELEARHNYLYKLAKRCFISANTLCHSEEVWLHYYMLGKIYEKSDTFKGLEYYAKAEAQLFLEGASYPKKISYHNPPELAYEAMEVHYRIHSSAMKFLLNSEEIDQSHLNRLREVLLKAQRSPFVTYEEVPDPAKSISRFIQTDVTYLVEDLADSVSTNAEFDELIFMCLHGMKRCLVRCDKNFKALYRLSYYYHKIRDFSMSQDILMVKDLNTDQRIQNLILRRIHLPEYRAAPPDLKGIDTLFKDRKIGNLFFNIWRIPVEEVDRPGCFEHWMYKCTSLLIQTSIELNDTEVLTLIAFQLSRQPETSKKYLQDKARLILARYASKSIIEIIHKAIEATSDVTQKRFFLTQSMAIADKFVKSNVFTEQMRELYNQLQNQLMTNSLE